MSRESWVAVQLVDHLHRVEELVHSAPATAGALAIGTGLEDESLISADEAEALRRIAEALAELGGRAQELAERLPAGDLWISRQALIDDAAQDLAEGIMDPDRVRLAARMLPVPIGWQALARALRSTDTHTMWGNLRVGELLAAFPGADEGLVRRVLAAAEVPERFEFQVCEEPALRRLAAALEEHAPER